jgi:hypothetical protein
MEETSPCSRCKTARGVRDTAIDKNNLPRAILKAASDLLDETSPISG